MRAPGRRWTCDDAASRYIRPGRRFRALVLAARRPARLDGDRAGQRRLPGVAPWHRLREERELPRGCRDRKVSQLKATPWAESCGSSIESEGFVEVAGDGSLVVEDLADAGGDVREVDRPGVVDHDRV